VNFGKSIFGYNGQMHRSYPIGLASALYVALLFTGLLAPRKATAELAPMGILNKIHHEILFLSGPLEVFLNFLLFAPVFYALLYLLPELSRPASAIVSCLASATAEIAQSQIDGRVSSWRDFFSNSIGVLIAWIALAVISKRKVAKKVLLP
jgi:glycopeptide antibiotics resistance protein